MQRAQILQWYSLTTISPDIELWGQENGTILEKMSEITHNQPVAVASLPSIWDYSDYRLWLTDAFRARKAQHQWYSYGVLAKKAGFLARDFPLRVMRGERRLSPESAERMADAMDLSRREKAYFVALVEFNQARKQEDQEIAWSKVQHALAKANDLTAPRGLTEAHREVLGKWHHLAVRALLEMRPDPGHWEALGLRLHPPRSSRAVRESVHLLERVGLVEYCSDGLWRATKKPLCAPSEAALPSIRNFYHECLELAKNCLDSVPVEERNVTGATLGISQRTYRLICERLAALREEVSGLAEADAEADRVYQLTLTLFPISAPLSQEEE